MQPLEAGPPRKPLVIHRSCLEAACCSLFFEHALPKLKQFGGHIPGKSFVRHVQDMDL